MLPSSLPHPQHLLSLYHNLLSDPSSTLSWEDCWQPILSDRGHRMCSPMSLSFPSFPGRQDSKFCRLPTSDVALWLSSGPRCALWEGAPLPCLAPDVLHVLLQTEWLPASMKSSGCKSLSPREMEGSLVPKPHCGRMPVTQPCHHQVSEKSTFIVLIHWHLDCLLLQSAYRATEFSLVSKSIKGTGSMVRDLSPCV